MTIPTKTRRRFTAQQSFGARIPLAQGDQQFRQPGGAKGFEALGIDPPLAVPEDDA